MNSLSSPIRSLTSDFGRDQFSDEKAKTVRYAMPSLAGGTHRLAHRLDAGAMAVEPRQAARLAPSGRCRP